jgi:hypothetical protein
MNEKIGKIFEALGNIMREIDFIEKKEKNTFHKFNFRGIDTVMNAMHSLLAKNSVVVVPEHLESATIEKKTKDGGVAIHNRARYKYRLISTIDGSEVAGIMEGEGMDTGDKSTPKAASIALKYFLLQTFLIPTEERKDPDYDSYEPAAAKKITAKEELRGKIDIEKLEKYLKDSLPKLRGYEDLTESQCRSILQNIGKYKKAIESEEE